MQPRSSKLEATNAESSTICKKKKKKKQYIYIYYKSTLREILFQVTGWKKEKEDG